MRFCLGVARLDYCWFVSNLIHLLADLLAEVREQLAVALGKVALLQTGLDAVQITLTN